MVRACWAETHHVLQLVRVGLQTRQEAQSLVARVAGPGQTLPQPLAGHTAGHQQLDLPERLVCVLHQVLHVSPSHSSVVSGMEGNGGG